MAEASRPSKHVVKVTAPLVEDPAIYDRGYFHGIGSGYPEVGYSVSHPDFGAWLDIVGQLAAPPGTLIDLGCAYGFLVDEARRRGYEAWGVDLSRFALGQEPGVRNWLSQGRLSALPLGAACARVVTLLDVVEHLGDPVGALVETRRILDPEGLLVLTTPDPLFFDRSEPTHHYERPPAFWIALLRQLGFQLCFRFSEVPYNFQILATPDGSSLAREISVFQHDYISTSPDFCFAEGLAIVPRSGWGPLEAGFRPVQQPVAMIYLLNESELPQEGQLRFRIVSDGRFSTLTVRLDSQVLKEMPLTSESSTREILIEGFLVPAGGHHLIFEVTPGGPRVMIGELQLQASPSSRRHLIESLPFDLFQRYEHAAEICRSLRPRTILDLGGLIGDRDGHMAHSGDFLAVDGAATVVSSDSRQCDHPAHLPADGLKTPFAQGEFEMVVSLDVLEHIRPDLRPDFLGELDRLSSRWIVLSAPFSDPQVERAEQSLALGIMRGQGFLEEHRSYGLPLLDDTVQFFRDRGFRVETYPNGFLPDWLELQVWTQLVFSLKEFRLYAAFNRTANRNRYRSGFRSPSYRQMVLVAKNAISSGEIPPPLSAPDSPREHDGMGWAFGLPLALAASLVPGENQRVALSEVQFLINARLQLIDLMNQETRELHQDRLALLAQLHNSQSELARTQGLLDELRQTPVLRIALNRWKGRRTRRQNR